ncbi:MAG: hypothetical protein ACLP74_05290 [Thermoplasmata archaeon]
MGRQAVHWLTVMVILASASAALLSAGAVSAMATPGFSVHCNTVVRSENLADDAVQLALNHASSGQTVCVGPGVFPEQVTISKPVRLVGAGATQTILEPTSVTFNTVDWDSANGGSSSVACGSDLCVPLAAIVLIENTTGGPTTGVTVANLEVNGSAGSSSIACGDDYVGVDFQDSAGTLKGAIVSDVASPISSFGCQEVSGAVYAYNGYFFTGLTPSPSIAVTVAHTTVTGYQKNGITCDDPGETCTLRADTVVGIGPTTLTGQNGIQIAYGAVGQMTSDLVANNAYTGSNSGLDWYGTGYQATGILLYQAGAGTSVLRSTLRSDAIGIAGVGDVSDTIQGNTITNSVAYGIAENGVPGTTASIVNNAIHNTVYHAIGILVDNGTFRLAHNSIFWVSTTGSQGASQPVTGPGTFYPSSPAASVSTAAIQAVSEGGPTVVTIVGTSYYHVSAKTATLGVFGGLVTIS